MTDTSEPTDEYARTIRPSVAMNAAWAMDATLAGPHMSSQGAPAAALPSLSVSAAPSPKASGESGGSGESGESDAALEAATDLELGDIIGVGGMGQVFVARQHSLSRDVAVKVPRDGTGSETSVALVAEGRITGQLEHPAIVPVHALGLDKQGRPAMVMKRIEGVEWERLARNPAHEAWAGWPGDEEDRIPGHLQIFIAICNAVHFAHSRGYLHRDIKLENVLIGRFGDVYLADWGLAERIGAHQEELCGTPGYLAPEMVGGHVVDERTDVYLLGATLHDILAGHMRHAARNVARSVLLAAESNPVVYEDSVPAELADLINRACHKDPDERPQSAEALRDEVTKILEFRSAAELAGEAQDRTERIRALVEEPRRTDEESDDEPREELERLIAQASFAFEQAFATGWRGNEAARADRDWLESLLAKRRLRLAELERQAQDRDPRRGAKHRAFALSALGMCGLVTTLYALYTEHQTTRVELLLFPLLFLACAAAFTVATREKIARTVYSRRAVGLVFILIGATCVSRAYSLFFEISTTQQLRQDSLMLTVGLAVGSLAWAKWLRSMAVCFALAYVGCDVWPEQSVTVFGVFSSAALFVAAGFQWSESRGRRTHAPLAPS
ncbi:MAG: serine/threonine-protein kinase [Polyangiales bacterium]